MVGCYSQAHRRPVQYGKIIEESKGMRSELDEVDVQRR
jgi:hypothetical protein